MYNVEHTIYIVSILFLVWWNRAHKRICQRLCETCGAKQQYSECEKSKLFGYRKSMTRVLALYIHTQLRVYLSVYIHSQRHRAKQRNKKWIIDILFESKYTHVVGGPMGAGASNISFVGVLHADENCESSEMEAAMAWQRIFWIERNEHKTHIHNIYLNGGEAMHCVCHYYVYYLFIGLCLYIFVCMIWNVYTR